MPSSIAFGGGITLSSVERQHPRHIDCVKVVPAVVEAAGNFAQHNNRIFERFDEPHLNVIIDDGRNHVLRTSKRYDAIISDATHPGTADSWVLYTEEFTSSASRSCSRGESWPSGYLCTG